MSSKKTKKKTASGNRRTSRGVTPFDIGRELSRALRYHQSGRLKKAQGIYDKILKADPVHSECLHLRGFMAYQAGKHDEAINLIGKAIENNPGNPIYYYNLAFPLLNRGELDEAISCYEKSLELKPDMVQAHVNMGHALQSKGRFDEAISCYEKALRLQPQAVAAHLNMGNAFQSKGNLDEAISSYKKALKVQPDCFDAYYNMGGALRSDGRIDEAASCYRKALKLKPEDPYVYYNLGNAFQDQGKLDEAIACYENVLKIRPDDVDAYNNMGNACKGLGRFGEAISCYRKALHLQPDCAEAFYLLARARKNTDQDLKGLLELSEQLNGATTEDGLTYLNFALGKVHDELGLFEKAFEYYRLGNTYERAKHQHDPEAYRAYISSIIETLTADFLRNKDCWANDSEMPIFIFGMPRSGTTLVEQIISSHPDVLGGGELEFFLRLEKRFASALGSTAYPKYVKRMDEATARKVSEGYISHVENLSRSSANQVRVTDKMPHNYLFLGLMFLLFPRARFIHCRRHPLDNCLSVYFQKFASGHDYAYDLSEIGLAYREYRRLMAHWLDGLQVPMFEVNYEDLVRHQERVSRQLLTFCGLKWHPGCLDFYKNRRPVFTSSNWQVRQPIYRSSVDRWKNYAQFLGPLKALLRDYL